MKVVIFAGGIGSRITEESHLKPKPMIEIGERPILWHIMKIFSTSGFNDFIICLGYKGHIIKEYFLNYYMYNSDVSIDLHSNKVDVHYSNSESMHVTLIDTGLQTKTAGRLKMIKDHIGKNDFMLTYGDAVSDINLQALLNFHKSHGRIATMTTILSSQTFGQLKFDDKGKVIQFREKSAEDAIWINGGYFILKPEVFNYLPENSNEIMWEDNPMNNLYMDNELYAYKHDGFWQCMDAMRDKILLDELWKNQKAKWKIWQ